MHKMRDARYISHRSFFAEEWSFNDVKILKNFLIEFFLYILKVKKNNKI